MDSYDNNNFSNNFDNINTNINNNNMNLGYVQQIAFKFGASEPAIRLLLSILLGYPLAVIYRLLIYKQSTLINQLFVIGTGCGICVFNYGWDFYHSFIAIVMTYLSVNWLRGNVMTITTFTFHMVYLLMGYYFTSTDTYDIKWTMPHCVLVLRLIGLAFDVADGQRPLEKLSIEQQKSYLQKPPNLLEIAAYTYFPASILVGPQFPFRRYNNFINKEFQKYTENVRYGLMRGGFGLIYLIIYQIGFMYISDDYLLSTEYLQHSLPFRLILLGIWGRLSLYKYISCWLLSEGVAACFGLTFVGVDKTNNKENWAACANIKLFKFESAGKFQHYVESFNVNTNHWLAEYVYKRLKFLGNRYLSHMGALLFLAVWHGFHSGYYACFLMEFIVINFEREIQSVLMRNAAFIRFASKPLMEPIMYLLLRLYAFVGMGWCLIPFIFLTYSKWWQVYGAVNYLGLIIFVPWPIYKRLLQIVLPPTLNKTTTTTVTTATEPTETTTTTTTKPFKVEHTE